MSDTPETDAFFFRTDIEWDDEVDFARKLERERNEARQALDEEMKFHHRTHGECVMAQCELMDVKNERDEARAWSARWKNAAKDWRRFAHDFLRRKRVLAQERDEARKALRQLTNHKLVED
jgi:hypothetical protein